MKLPRQAPRSLCLRDIVQSPRLLSTSPLKDSPGQASRKPGVSIKSKVSGPKQGLQSPKQGLQSPSKVSESKARSQSPKQGHSSTKQILHIQGRNINTNSRNVKTNTNVSDRHPPQPGSREPLKKTRIVLPQWCVCVAWLLVSLPVQYPPSSSYFMD